ncbi:MAG: type IV pilus secretin PilQ [Oligoflexia bacterium]|nr:type IV pilus secretin PilQ [Oligoflexia bacterium]
MQRPLFLAAAASFLLAAPPAWSATRVTSIDFKGTSDPAIIEVRGDGPLTFEKQENADDRQVVIELEGARIGSAVARKIDTSSFAGKLLMISPYQVKGEDKVRIVLQLKAPVETQVQAEGNLLRISVPSESGAGEGESGETAGSGAGSEDGAGSDDALAAGDAGSKDTGRPGSDFTGMTGAADRLKEFESSRNARTYTGKRITLQVRDMEAVDIFRLIGEASGFNIILAPEVKGTVTLSLVSVPWDQALDVVLQTLKLGAERNNNILRVMSLENLTREKIEEVKASMAAKAAAPKITRVFPVSYANLEDLAKIIQTLQGESASEAANAAAMGGGGTNARTIIADKRTNSLIVRELPENMDRIQKLVEILDTQTPQVLIEAKVIETSEGNGNNLNGVIGGLGRNPDFLLSFNGANASDSLLGTPALISGLTTATAGGGGLRMSLAPGSGRLNLGLDALESENKVKILASPKTVVLNKEKASIIQTTPVAVLTRTRDATGAETVTPKINYANLSLDVKPTVTNDGSVLMELVMSRDLAVPAGNNVTDVGSRKLTTQVIVESGNTLVLGGLYTLNSSQQSRGMPFLRKIPILGALFGEEETRTERSELFFFITPQIINPKKAGFGSS